MGDIRQYKPRPAANGTGLRVTIAFIVARPRAVNTILRVGTLMPYIPGNLPVELKSLKIWALSAEGQVNRFGAPFSPKAPLIPISGQDWCRGVIPTKSDSWRTFDEVDAWQDIVGGYPGLMVSNGFVGFDFDLEKGSTEFRAWVETEVLPRCPGYVERSPSGQGFRAIVTGTIPVSRKTRIIEVYNRDRFLRMTGDVVPCEGAMEGQAWIDWVYGTLPSIAGYEDIEATPVTLACDLSVEQLEQRYIEILDELPPHEKSNIEKIDRGEFDDGSDAARMVCIALLRAEDDPAVVFSMLLANEGIQQHYGNKHGANAAAQLARKFINDWYPKGRVTAQRANDEAEKHAAVIPMIRAMVEAEEYAVIAREQELNALSLERAQMHREERVEYVPGKFPEFPVPIVREYRDWLRGSVIETEQMLVNAATLSHLATLCARRYATATNSLLNLYTIVLARQGAGKEVLSGGFSNLLTQINQPSFMLPLPKSDIALHKDAAGSPSGLLILKEFGDRLTEWCKTAHPARMVPSILKDIYGINAGGAFTGASYSDQSKNVAPIQNPAISLLGEGTREQVLNALGNYGHSDGFVGRLLFIESGTQWVDNLKPHTKMPESLAQAMRDIGSFCIGMPNIPFHPITVGVDDDAHELLEHFKAEERKQKRDEDNVYMPFWRAATQNAWKLASIMAVYRSYTQPKVTLDLATWAIAVVRYSISMASGHMDADAAYSSVDRKAAMALEKMIYNFFSWTKGAPAAQKARAEGYFRLGYLGHKHQAIKDHPKGEQIALEIAFAMLVSDGKIDCADDKKERFSKNLSASKYRLGEMWGH